MAEPFRILVVCTANVCRSPLAERVLTSELADLGDLVVVESAGVQPYPGQPMCAEGAALLGVDPAAHASRELTASLLEAADLIVTADRSHTAAAARLLPSCRPRLFTLTQAAALARPVVADVAEGLIPDAAPPMPDDKAQRLRWLVGEMDAARGRITPLGGSPDIEDDHGAAPHEATLRACREAAVVLGEALRAV